MIDKLIFAMTLLSALGCGLMAGVFFAFSAFIMKALAKLPAEQGIGAMQSINVAAVTPLFMTALFGTAGACLLLAFFSFAQWQKTGSGYVLAGSLLYLIGSILVTVAFNVPRNDTLAALDPASVASVAPWTSFIRSWTVWNHVRGVASLLAAASFTVALVENFDR